MSVIEAARRHASEVVAPGVERWEREGRFPRDAVETAAADGLCGLFAPSEAGGQGLTFAEGMGVFEELGRADASYAFALSMHNAVTTVITRFAHEEVRERWAGPLTSGRALGGFSLTEPHAGSDAAAITTRAEPDGSDGYLLSGRKAWVSLAGEVDVFALVCRTGDAPGYEDVMVVALAADQPGVRVSRLYDTMASAFLPIGDVELDGARVSATEVIAPPGAGFQAALGAIDVARVDIAAISVGLAAEALEIALRHAASRRMFGGVELDLQAIQFALADVETDVVAGRLLYRHAAELLGGPEGGRRGRARQALLPRRGPARRRHVQRGARRLRLAQRDPAPALHRAREDAPGRRRHDGDPARRDRPRATPPGRRARRRPDLTEEETTMSDSVSIGTLPPLGEVPPKMLAQVVRQDRLGEPRDAFRVEEIDTPQIGPARCWSP